MRNKFDHLEQDSPAASIWVMATDDDQKSYAGEDYEKGLVRPLARALELPVGQHTLAIRPVDRNDLPMGIAIPQTVTVLDGSPRRSASSKDAGLRDTRLRHAGYRPVPADRRASGSHRRPRGECGRLDGGSLAMFGGGSGSGDEGFMVPFYGELEVLRNF